MIRSKSLRKAVQNVHIQSGRGKGNAIIQAFEIIEQPYILMLDGDGTYSPKDAEKMLIPLFAGFDQVIGDRLINAEEGAFLSTEPFWKSYGEPPVQSRP